MLTASGTLSYNGFEFGVYTKTAEVSVRPQMDESGRVNIYNVYTFQFKSTLFAEDRGDCSLVVAAARAALTKPGGAFIFTGRGLADFYVNVPGLGFDDVAWGPVPKQLRLKHHGALSCDLDWSLEVAVPDCERATTAGRPMEYVYGVTYTRDEAGYSTRAISGHLRIPPGPRGPGGTIRESADDYRELVNPPIPPGYRRRYGPFRLDAAKTRLDFEIIDEEMTANIPPAGVIKCSVKHSAGSTSKGLLSWTNSLAGNYVLERGVDPAVAVRAFLGLLRDRVKRLAFALNGEPKAAKESSKCIIPVRFHLEEPDVYGPPTVVISCDYTFTVGLPETAIGNSGLWQPPPGSGAYGEWAASLAGGFNNPRGLGEIRFDPGALGDRGVSLCDSADVPTDTTDIKGVPPPVADKAGLSDLIGKAFPLPDAATSWLSYDCAVVTQMDSGTVAMKLVPEKPLTRATDLTSTATDFVGYGTVSALEGTLTAGTLPVGTAEAKSPPPPPPPPPPAPDPGGQYTPTPLPATPPARAPGRNPYGVATQRRTRPVCYLTLTGSASRAGYPVPVPRLTSVDGQVPVPANRLDRGEGFVQTIGFAAGAIPIYQAKWCLRYYLEAVPLEVGVPVNPMLGVSE